MAKVHQAAMTAFINHVRHDALDGFSGQIRNDMVDGTPRARKLYKRSKPHRPLWTSVTIEREGDSHFIGSRRPYQSVAEDGQRRDGTHRWRDQSRTGFMKRALYKKRIGRHV